MLYPWAEAYRNGLALSILFDRRAGKTILGDMAISVCRLQILLPVSSISIIVIIIVSFNLTVGACHQATLLGAVTPFNIIPTFGLNHYNGGLIGSMRSLSLLS